MAPLDLATLAPGLEQREPGVWFARTRTPVSYPAHGNAAHLAVEDRSFWFRHRNRCIISLARHFPPRGVLLDIGGGNGFVASGLAKAGFICAVIEPGIDGALAAHARGIDPVICARLEDTQLPQASVAAVGMFDVLEHMADDTAVLGQLHALLERGGRLYVTVPAYQFLFSADDIAAGHLRRYTLSGLARTLSSSGFTVEFASYVFAPLPPLIFLLRVLPSRLGLRRPSQKLVREAEHVPAGASSYAIDCLLTAEWRRIEAGRTIPFGGSCLCVAAKS
jgi:SAM-dependent methyltransferase